ncbi:MAG: hypothetical protein IPL78_17950 [Chloroflexi bacterium]|nr:hypothetical protein [Chloroflexota bacterium]
MSKSGHLIWLLWLLLLVGCGSQGGEKAKVESDAAAATFTSSPAIPATLAPAHTPRTEVITILTEDDRPDALRRITADWQTNWTRHTIRYDEILSGGRPVMAFLPWMNQNLWGWTRPRTG